MIAGHYISKRETQMTRNEQLEYHINAIAQEVFRYIEENSFKHKDGWIPAVKIKHDLNIRAPEIPQNKDKGARGWLFGIAASRLESRSCCRVKKQQREQCF